MENIRVKIKLDGINYNSFLIKDFHYVPREKDLIEVQNFIVLFLMVAFIHFFSIINLRGL